MDKVITGKLVSGDFEENTMTFEIDGDFTLQAGEYRIERINKCANDCRIESIIIADKKVLK